MTMKSSMVSQTIIPARNRSRTTQSSDTSTAIANITKIQCQDLMRSWRTFWATCEVDRNLAKFLEPCWTSVEFTVALLASCTTCLASSSKAAGMHRSRTEERRHRSYLFESHVQATIINLLDLDLKMKGAHFFSFTKSMIEVLTYSGARPFFPCKQIICRRLSLNALVLS